MASDFDLQSFRFDPGIHLLEASAGTGKTYTLVGLILRLVVDGGKRLPEILAVTFTNKATGELAERLRLKLADAARLLGNPDTQPLSADPQLRLWQEQAMADGATQSVRLQRIRQALTQTDSAAIFTIHGFCRRVLTECAFESGLPLSLDLQDSGSGFVRTAVRDFLRELYSPLADDSAEADRINAARIVRNEIGVCEEWLATLAGSIGKGAQVVWEDLGDSFARAELGDGPKMQAKIQALTSYLAQRNEALLRFSDKLSSISHDDPTVIPSLLDTLAVLDLSIGEIVPDTKNARETAYAVLGDFVALAFAHRFSPKVSRLKAEAGALSFDDLIRKTALAVEDKDRGPELARRLREGYQAAFIDEFQDTDADQCIIFRTIFSGLPLVFIGDPKQSIYRFRGADLHAYLDAARHTDTRASLDTNYRSSARMIAAANALFADDSSLGKASLFSNNSGITFTAVKPSPKPAPDLVLEGSPLPALTIVWAGGNEVDSLTKAAAAESCAVDTASRIHELLDGAHQLGGLPLRPRDIAVLVDSGSHAEDVHNALREQGVPAVRSGGSVFSSDAARHMRMLMQAILTPRRPSKVRAALISPFYGYNAQQLHLIDGDTAAYQGIIERLDECGRRWAANGFAAAFGWLVTTEKSLVRIRSLPTGERLLADIRQLVELVAREERDSHLAPSAALGWFEQSMIEAYQAGLLPAENQRQRLESDSDCVSILTMHTAKGLEFPVVFIPFAWTTIDKGRARFAEGNCEKGGSTRRAVGLRASTPGLATAADRDEYMEKARLLYVAVTRAKSACFLHTGRIENVGAVPLGRIAPTIDADALACADRNGWQALALAHPGLIDVKDARSSRTTTETQGTPSPADTAEVLLPAREFTASIDRTRIAASYSGLVRALAMPDDPVAKAASPQRPAEVGAGYDIFSFPRGAAAGEALHQILAAADFTKTVSKDTIARLLREHGIDDAIWASVIGECIQAWMATPLTLPDGGSFLLGELANADRVAEMGFDLPARLTHGQGIASALSLAASPPLPKSFLNAIGGHPIPQLDGYLTGFIDLVFRYRDRYYIVDWKSNHLGHRIADYSGENVAAAMESHQYHLQYHLYLVALDSHLRSCLPDYDPARHLGGVYYLFLRGLDPLAPGMGVFRAEAEPAVISALANALQGDVKSATSPAYCDNKRTEGAICQP